MSEQELQNFQKALKPVSAYLANKLLRDAKGIAIFSRAGNDPFFLPLQFRILLPNWIAVACGFKTPKAEKPAACPECCNTQLKDSDLKEEMVRLAENQGCKVEFVNESEALGQLGGVGCLLRYHLPGQYEEQSQ